MRIEGYTGDLSRNPLFRETRINAAISLVVGTRDIGDERAPLERERRRLSTILSRGLFRGSRAKGGPID